MKSFVKGNQDFSGTGKLYSKVDHLSNRQSALESRLTREYDLNNDINEDSILSIHVNNENRAPVQNFGLGKRPNFFLYPEYIHEDTDLYTYNPLQNLNFDGEDDISTVTNPSINDQQQPSIS